MTADEALAIIAKEYDMGAGGGQLSNLIHEVLTLRAQGFKAVECEQACNRGGVGETAESDPAYRGLEGDARLSAQAAGADAGLRTRRQQPGSTPASASCRRAWRAVPPGVPPNHRHRPRSGHRRHYAADRLACRRARRKTAEHPGLPARTAGRCCWSTTSSSTTPGCAARTASRTASRCCSSTRRSR